MAYLRSEKARVVQRNEFVSGVPHIRPGKLYPAYRGILNQKAQNKFTDSSASAHTCAPVNTTHHSGAQKKVGSTSMKFDYYSNGTSPGQPANDEIVVSGTLGDFDLPNDTDWTLELWIYMLNPTTSWTRILGKDTDNNGWALHMDSSTGRLQFGHDSVSIDPSNDLKSNSNTAITAKTWTHIAIVHNNSANSLIMYKDGVAVITKSAYNGSQPIQNWWTSTGKALLVGNRYNNSYYYDGYMDEIRIVLGTAVYSGAFTPPTALTTTGGTYASGTNVNSSFTASHTKLLMHSDEGGNVGAWGTVQSDGKMYYYTDIEGSEPINDPRIGAYFGAQRYRFGSLQEDEQGSGVHGTSSSRRNNDVGKIDGREWMRTEGRIGYNTDPIYYRNISYGTLIQQHRKDATHDQGRIEITGYFSDAIWNMYTGNNRTFAYTLDGTQDGGNHGPVTQSSPILSGTGANRFVPAGSNIHLDIPTAFPEESLGIHTLQISCNSTDDILSMAVELIAQDQSTTANRSKIQIPSQNVVTGGKKTTISAQAHHYDPFNGFVNDTSLFSDFVDIGTSLGLGTATTWGAAWDKGSSNHIRPYNGGRVVKWADRWGKIQTSVTMMPPNAQNITTTAVSEITVPSATNTSIEPNYSNDAIEHSLAEVAKTFHWREFGNGAGNSGTGSTFGSAGAPDHSQLSGLDVVAYVMDDGLTSAAGGQLQNSDAHGCFIGDDNYWDHWVFIGTGISWDSNGHGINTLAQNLPYGTHIIKRYAGNHHSTAYWLVDGRIVKGAGVTPNFSTSGGSDYIYNWGPKAFINYYQPKMPPIPPDAVILADYMLMADFVPRTDTTTTNAISKPTKGTRRINLSRDWFFDNTSGNALNLNQTTGESASGFSAGFGSGSGNQYKSELPAFCTNFVATGYNIDQRCNLFIDGVDTASTTSGDVDNNGTWGRLTNNVDLGVHVVRTSEYASGYNTCYDFDIVTPIHTSHHYQPFETPYLYELLGGDRNMEQTNLVVTPDGKTWDEVTRDTSYIGNTVFTAFEGEAAHITAAALISKIEEYRGGDAGFGHWGGTQKDWAIAQDRWICLKAGHYHISMITRNLANFNLYLIVNSTTDNATYSHLMKCQEQYMVGTFTCPDLQLHRGDTIYLKLGAGTIGGEDEDRGFRIQITKKEQPKKYRNIGRHSTRPQSLSYK